jgi:ribonucleoside-diphosphate reductase alpha chain
MAHVKMMAAAQPFLSGAISKTVNLPNDATVEDVQKIYEEGWKLGLKAVALYRDGCKASQPLSSSSDEEGKPEVPRSCSSRAIAPRRQLRPAGPTGVRVPAEEARGFTQEARVGGHKIFLRTGEYVDGTLGEIFIDMHKEGAAFRSPDELLRHGGVDRPAVRRAARDRSSTSSPSRASSRRACVEGHENIKLATSIVDYIFRVLGVEYLHRYDLAHVPATSASTAATRWAAADRCGGGWIDLGASARRKLRRSKLGRSRRSRDAAVRAVHALVVVPRRSHRSGRHELFRRLADRRRRQRLDLRRQQRDRRER